MYSAVVTVGGSFFAGFLIGYALKKVVKLVAAVVGLFLHSKSYLILYVT